MKRHLLAPTLFFLGLTIGIYLPGIFRPRWRVEVLGIDRKMVLVRDSRCSPGLRLMSRTKFVPWSAASDKTVDFHPKNRSIPVDF